MNQTGEEDLFHSDFGTVQDGYDFFVRLNSVELLKVMLYAVRTVEPFQTMCSLNPSVLYDAQDWEPQGQELHGPIQFPAEECNYGDFRKAEEAAIRAAIERAKQKKTTLRDKSAADGLEAKIRALQCADISKHEGFHFFEELPTDAAFVGYEALAFAKDEFDMVQLARFAVAQRGRDITGISYLPTRYIMQLMVQLQQNYASEESISSNNGEEFRRKEENEIRLLRTKVRGGSSKLRIEYGRSFFSRMYFLRLQSREPGVDKEVFPRPFDNRPLNDTELSHRRQCVRMCASVLKNYGSADAVLGRDIWPEPDEDYLALCTFKCSVVEKCLCGKEEAEKSHRTEKFISLNYLKDGFLKHQFNDVFKYMAQREQGTHCCTAVNYVTFLNSLPVNIFVYLPRLSEPPLRKDSIVVIDDDIDVKKLCGSLQFENTLFQLDGMFCMNTKDHIKARYFTCFPSFDTHWTRHDGNNDDTGRKMNGYDWKEAYKSCLVAVYSNPKNKEDKKKQKDKKNEQQA